MIHKLTTLTVALSLTTMLMADANKSQSEISELIPLPHFKRLLASSQDLLKLSQEQNEKIKMQVFAKLRTKIHGAIETAEQLEVKIMNAVLKDQKTKEDLKADIERLIEIKREIANGHIDAANIIAKTLTKEQYAKLLVIIEKQHGSSHK